MLADWGVLPDARGRSAPAPISRRAVVGPCSIASSRPRSPRPGPSAPTAVAERDAALSANDELTAELEAAQARLTELERSAAPPDDGERGDAEAALAEQAAELDRALGRERERAEELERSLDARAASGSATMPKPRGPRCSAPAPTPTPRGPRFSGRGPTPKSARADLEKARARGRRGPGGGRRRARVRGRAPARRSSSQVKQSRDSLAALERQQGADDSGAQLLKAEKARPAAEAALADAVAERDATLKARAALTGELEHERSQVAALHESAAAAEERIRELTGDVERERVRAAGLEQVQARIQRARGRASPGADAGRQGRA